MTVAATLRAPFADGTLLTSPLLPIALAWLGIGVALAGTFADMWRAWGASGTFAHGYLILPISLYLVWARRARWIGLPARPSLLGVVLVTLAVLLWLAGFLLSLNVIMQFAAIAMLVASVLAIGGQALVRAMAFPLLFLFFAVPAGEELVPLLMDFTARFTVGALDAVGIPVYAEGRLISIPTGNFSVEKACSGIRYLIASVVLGTLFAHLYYRSFWRRALFVALCALVPIIANGLRAFLIVILAHWSDHRIAVGVDHLIYGWVFFGFVMLLVFWIGRRFAEPRARAPQRQVSPVAAMSARGTMSAPWITLAGVLLPAIAGSALAAALQNGPAQASTAAVDRVPASRTGWTGPISISTDWQPRFQAPTRAVTASYLRGVQPVDVALVEYEREQAGAELINSENLLFDAENWTWLGERSLDLPLAQGLGIPVFEVRIRDGLSQRVIWRTFVVGGVAVSGGMQAKLQRARSLMGADSAAGQALIVSVRSVGANPAPERLLREFLVNYYTPLLACLRDDAGSSAACVAAP